MGIKPETIHTVGAPGLDDLETDPVCEFGEGFFLVTLHPETAGATDNIQMARELCAALDRFPDRQVVITASNNDPGGAEIHEVIRLWRAEERNVDRARFVANLGRRRYLTAMKHAAVVIGNSSSGIIEAPALGTPTVNIGRRQFGRPLASSVVEAVAVSGSIEHSVRVALQRIACPDKMPPYGAGGASKKIAEVLASWNG